MKKRVQMDTVPVMTNRKALRAKVYWVTYGIQKTVDASVMLGYSQLDIERMIALWVSNNKESGKGNSED